MASHSDGNAYGLPTQTHGREPCLASHRFHDRSHVDLWATTTRPAGCMVRYRLGMAGMRCSYVHRPCPYRLLTHPPVQLYTCYAALLVHATECRRLGCAPCHPVHILYQPTSMGMQPLSIYPQAVCTHSRLAWPAVGCAIQLYYRRSLCTPTAYTVQWLSYYIHTGVLY